MTSASASLKQFVEDPTTATEAQIKAAAEGTIPDLPGRVSGVPDRGRLRLDAVRVRGRFWLNATKRLEQNRWLLWMAVVMPAPDRL